MGCSNSFEAAYQTAEFQGWMKQFEAMQLSKSEVRTLYYIFARVDFDKSGQIALAELLAHIDLERTRFTERIFSIFDADGSGEIDFREFVLSLWNYCTLTKATLDMFAFDLYDKDGSGELSGKEVTQMLQDIYGKKEVKSNYLARTVASDLKAIDDNGTLLNIEEYRQFVRTHQALLFPAFQMQLALQRKVLGVRFWERNAERRLKFSNGKYISVGNFILMNVDASKKAVLHHQSPIAVAMGGNSHKDDHMVGKMMELAGTKASRKKVTEENFQRQASMKLTTGAELFSVEQMKVNTSVPLTEAKKKEWLQSIVGVPSLFRSNSKTKSEKTNNGTNNGTNGTPAAPISPKVKQIQVTSSKGMLSMKSAKHTEHNNNNNNVVSNETTGKTINDTPPANSRRKSFDNEHTVHSINNNNDNNVSEKANNISGAYLKMGIATAGERIRESIKLKTGFSSKKNTIYAENSEENYHNNVINASVSHMNDGTSYKYIEPTEPVHTTTATGNVPSGKIKNSNLTTSAVKQIDLVSPIDAWEKQKPTTTTTTATSTLSTKNSSNGASFSSKYKPPPKVAVIDASALPITHTVSANTNTTLGAHAYVNIGTPVSTIGLNAPTSSKVHRNSSSSSKKFDTIGFSTKGNSSVKVRPTIGEEEEDVNGSFGAEADYTSSTRKSNRRSFGAEDTHFGTNNINTGTGATAGTLSTKYEQVTNHNSSFSSKDGGVSKKSRRRSLA